MTLGTADVHIMPLGNCEFRDNYYSEMYVLLYKKILCITHAVEHNYILPSSIIGIQLHVSALYVGHLHQVEIQLTDQLYKMCGVFSGG